MILGLVSLFLFSPLAPPQGPRHQVGGRIPWSLDPAGPGQPGGIDVDTQGDLCAVVWVENGIGIPEIRFATSTDAGLTYGPFSRVDSDISGSSKIVTDSSLVMSGPNIDVFWMDNRNVVSEVWHRSSADGGATWGQEEMLDVLAGRRVIDYRAAISQDGSRLVVAASVESVGGGPGAIHGLVLVRSSDAGATWSSTNLSTDGPVPAFDLATNLDPSEESVHIVALNDATGSGYNAVYAYSSHDFGMNFNPPVQLNSSAPGSGTISVDRVSVSATGSDVVAAWAEARTGQVVPEGYLALSQDGGITFASDMQVTQAASAPAGAVKPVAMVHRDAIYYAWADARYSVASVFLSKSFDKGLTWVEQQLGFGWNPVFAGDNTTDYVACLFEDTVGMRGSYTSNSGADFSPPFILNEANFNPAATIAACYDPWNKNFVCGWVQPDVNGILRPLVGGFRPCKTMMGGMPTAGGSVRMVLADYPVSESFWNFQILFSGSPGFTPLPGQDGRSIGIAWDKWSTKSLKFSLFSGILNSSGGAWSNYFNIPNSIAPGTVLYATSVSFQVTPTGPEFGTATDAHPITFF